MNAATATGLVGPGRNALPVASAILAVLVDALALPTALPAPLLTLAVVMFWAIHRPALLGAAWTCVLAIALDMLTGVPPGLTATALLLARHLLPGPARPPEGHPFFVLWLRVTLTIVAAETIRWAIACLYWQHGFAPMPLVHEAALTAAAWPLVTMLLEPLASLLPPDEHAPGR